MESSGTAHDRVKEVCTQCGKTYAAGTSNCPADGMELMRTMADPMIGMVLPRRYRVLSLLGRGSMSVVYKGLYEPLEQPVAIKLLKAHLVSDPHQAKRFQQEIKTAGALNHPNIVGILDFGVTDQGVPYLIMDYLDGKSMSDILDADERLSVNRVIKMFSQAAGALSYAHACGVIHRDIKPSNIVVVDEGDDKDHIKIVDFGIAKIMGHGDSLPGVPSGAMALTATGEVIGTPLYMSPEQANGRDLDGRSDIYSLGCVMYHAITGKPPFVGDTAIDTIRLQITGLAAPIDKVRPDLYIPERMRSIITKALQKDPRLRYQHMELLKADLESCIPRQEPAAPTSARTSRTPRPADSLAQTLDEKLDRRPRLPVLLVAGIALIVVSISALGLVTIRSKTHSAPTAKATKNDNTWRQLLVAAQNASSAGQYMRAEALFDEDLKQAAQFPAPDVRTATTLSGLASVYYIQSKLSQAETACKKALDIYQATSPNDSGRAEIFASMSKIYCDMGNPAIAQECAERSLEIRKATLGAENQEVANSLQCLAGVALIQGDYKRADQLLTEALSMSEKALGSENPDVASVAHDLGMVRQKEGNDKSAEELFNRALSSRQKFLGMQHPAVADTLCALGVLDFKVRHDASAETMFKNALSIRQNAFGENNLHTAEVYSCLASFYDQLANVHGQQNRDVEAEQCYRKALSIRQTIWGATNPKLSGSLQDLVAFLQSRHRAADAQSFEAKINHLSKTAP